MGINRDFLGRTFPAALTYEVSRVKIAEFAGAIGDPNPVYTDPAAARAVGHPDVIAPPTFAMVISNAAGDPVMHDPALGLDFAMVVHREQRFEYSRQIVAGDVLTAGVTISDIRDIGPSEMITTQIVLTAADGGHVCTAHSTLVRR